MSKLTKLLPLLLFMLIVSFIPSQANATENETLTKLPYNQPINHNHSYDDFLGKASILVFGNSNYEYGLKDFISIIDNLITTNQLNNQLNLLYFDIELTKAQLKTYIDKQNWNHVYAFSGGNDAMWGFLISSNMTSSVSLPVVVYVSKDGDVKSIATGAQDAATIQNNYKKIINVAATSQAKVQYKVLADVNGDSITNRKAEIYTRLQAINQTSAVSYDKAPNVVAPYASGSIKQSYQQNALRTLNLVRYLSGLPAVTLNSEYVSYAQHGAVLMAASSYGHTPSQPSDMSDSFYEIGYKGTSQGNIYYGYSNLYNAIVHGWMADEDSRNIDRVGHRRWALNPTMSSTGFGEANRLGVMYAFDKAAPEIEYEAIAYPSGSAFPSELFAGAYPWSVSLNPYIFATPDAKKVTVTLSGGGKTYSFSSATSSFDGNYLNIDTAGYGINNSIIFRPNGIKQYKGMYKVKIDGLTTILGDAATLSYETTFYDVSEQDGLVNPSSWAEQGVKRAIELKLLPDSLASNYQAPITRAEFSQLAVILYEALKGPIHATATFSDTNDLSVRKMATLGIVSGTGNDKFSPNTNITREQAAKILDLLLVQLGEASNTNSVTYADQTKIANWAISYVNSVSNRGIMGSSGANKFDPKGAYTREQSIITLLRVYDLVR